MMDTTSRPRGFTLAEVLVVISVIALLIGVLLPVVGEVGNASRKVQGQANLRSMGQAARSWSIEHGGQLPPAMLTGSDADSTSGDVRCWDWWTRENDPTFSRPGLLWEYTDHPDRVLQCPAYAGNDNWNGPATPCGYNYNVAFVAAMSATEGVEGQGCWDLLLPKASLYEPGEDPTNSSPRTDLALAQCRRASTTALFGEGGFSGGTNKFMRSPVHDVELAYAGAQAFRHRGWSNVGWIDGHVAAIGQPRRGTYWSQLPPHMQALLDYPSNGFLSEGDEAYDPR